MQNIERGQPKLWQKIAAGLITAIIMFFIMTSLFGSKSDKIDGSNPKNSEFSQEISIKDVEVKNISIKKVDNGYDYWFFIKNTSTTTLENAKLYIGFLDSQGKEITSREFSQEGSTKPQVGTTVKINARSIPNDGVHSFRFWVKEGNTLIKNGTGTFTEISK